VQDDKPVPKIIDFGAAKATSQRLTEHTVATELGQLIGTPESNNRWRKRHLGAGDNL